MSAVALNQPFSLFFGAGIVLIPVIFECMRAPPVPAGKGG
ncbi:putative membrane protein [Escherichia coli p0305293.8]|nr:putative membrane protein [Escherichia coli p0305293.8]KDA60387.1 putative membrane protein [Escherichia coli 2-011-08_S1_C1]